MLDKNVRIFNSLNQGLSN